MSQPDSLHRPSGSSSSYEWNCGSCGTTYIAKSASCPRCGGLSGVRGQEELTKKVIDDNDLRKGGSRW